MPQSELLSMLRCPEDRSTLVPADNQLVEHLNAAIRRGVLVNRGGKCLEQEIDGGLIRADGSVLYPIVDGIPVLLKDEAIPIADHAPGRSEIER
jgi:uncharacterized protein YbaR (Trm112 family)